MRPPDYKTPDGTIRLFCCRCEDLLAELDDRAVSVTITSPPYNTLQGETKAYGFRRRECGRDGYLEKLARIGYADNRPERAYQAWLAWVVAELLRVSDGPVWVNHKLRYRDDEAVFPVRFLPFPVWNRVLWVRRGSMAQNCRKFKPSTEEVLAFGRRKYWAVDEGQYLDFWDDLPPERGCQDHACPWPLELPLRLIRATCPPGGTVFDPFMGRATGAAAVLRASCGRRFIGCDSDAAAFQAAVSFVEGELENVLQGQKVQGRHR